MLRLMSKRKEIEEVIKQEHTSTCCANKYTLEIYMQEREQVKVFNEWFQNIYDTSVLGVDVLNADRIAHAMLLFTYTAAELRNQLKLKCVEKGKIKGLNQGFRYRF